MTVDLNPFQLDQLLDLGSRFPTESVLQPDIQRAEPGGRERSRPEGKTMAVFLSLWILRLIETWILPTALTTGMIRKGPALNESPF